MTARPRRLARLLRHRAGNAAVEFALGLPVMMTMGLGGVEYSNIVFTQMQLSQIALTLADNASRISVANGQATLQLREGDINDILQGARLTGGRLNLTAHGRITLSSLENIAQTYSDHTSDTTDTQRIHWQRCIGQRGGARDPGFDSSYGTVSPLVTAGSDNTYANRGTASAGLGPTPQVTSPANGGVMFVEINYEYQPLFGTLYTGRRVMHSIASFIVRDKRDFTQIYNPVSALGTKAVPSTCNLYNS